MANYAKAVPSVVDSVFFDGIVSAAPRRRGVGGIIFPVGSIYGFPVRLPARTSRKLPCQFYGLFDTIFLDNGDGFLSEGGYG